MRSRRTVLRAVKPAHRIIGVDASLVSTGFAYREDGEVYTGRITSDKRACARLWHNAKNLERVLDQVQPTIMVIEGYSMGSKGNTFNIGEWGGLARLTAWSRGIMIATVPPATLKKLITGNGSAKKPQVIASIAERFGLAIPQDDEADAFALLAIGEAYFLRRGPADLVQQVQTTPKNKKQAITTENGMLAFG